jgi:hypothetical protein
VCAETFTPNHISGYLSVHLAPFCVSGVRALPANRDTHRPIGYEAPPAPGLVICSEGSPYRGTSLKKKSAHP